MILRSYFEGWYFRQQSDGGTLALIPAVHADKKGKKSASVQIITDHYTKLAEYPAAAFSADRNQMHIRVGGSTFSRRGIRLRIEGEELAAEGELVFGELTPPRYDIMGPFKMVPFMECRHSLVSLRHTVDGRICVNGEETVFFGGSGYIEGDRGRSFPKRYIWTQCSFGERDSLMLSVADIPFLGGHFTGIVGAVLLCGREYRIATYCGARVVSIGEDFFIVRQGELCLYAELLNRQEQQLRAPVMGDMTRLVRESAACNARYVFMKSGETLLDIESDSAGFEFEWQ